MNDNVTVLAGKTLNTDNLKCVTNTGLSTGVLTVGDNMTLATGKNLIVGGQILVSNNTQCTTTQTGANGNGTTGGHSITISNIGSNNNVSVLQNGTTNPNSATINVTGSNASVSVTQH